MDTIKNLLAKPSDAPINSTPTKMSSGSGAEQDRYEGHFGTGLDVDKVKAGVQSGVHDMLTAKGSGAEQDRYQEHFSTGMDADKVKAAAQSMMNSGGATAGQNTHGLGFDGQNQARILAGTKGVGAEQDRFGSHFGVDQSEIQKAGQSIGDAAKNITGTK